MTDLRYCLPSTLAGVIWPERSSSAARATRALALVVLGSLVLIISARIQVPFYPVPMTLQSLAVLLIGAAYGFRLGGLTLAAYLLEGALGMPVFAGTPEHGIGLAYMMGPTGGFLLGYVAAAALVGLWAERGANRSLLQLIAAMTLGHAVVFALGFAWLAHLLGAPAAYRFGIEPFILATIVKTLLAALSVSALWGLVAKMR
jgi:biotin transport system substrate-specific component